MELYYYLCNLFIVSIDHLHIIGLFRASSGSLGKLLSDLSGIGLLADVIEKSIKKTLRKIRKTAFDKMLEGESYRVWDENVIIMKGAKPNETELQTVLKLAKTGEYYIIFPSDGQIKEIKKLIKEPGEKRNDVYLIDKITYKAMAVDIKTCGNPSVETIIAHLSGGVNQAPSLILDITGKIEKAKLIVGLRRGWSKGLRYVFLNYHGQWYLLDRDKVFCKNWILKMVK